MSHTVRQLAVLAIGMLHTLSGLVGLLVGSSSAVSGWLIVVGAVLIVLAWTDLRSPAHR